MNQEMLHQLFEYRDGELYRKIKKGKANVGDIAGCDDGEGYMKTRVNGKKYRNHRLIFLMHHGYLPDFVDHIDGNRSNNRIENLREATKNQNGYNRKLSIRNTSGVKGVTWYKQTKKWRVQIRIHGVKTSIGYFDDLELAGLVAEEARNKYHKEFANHE